ncbi:MAG TPA: DEAD/DEAH box helicase [Kofleriaceae bacterium]|nr:DEAD/DEAH box helicase [Kofleriaceae bacterium]
MRAHASEVDDPLAFAHPVVRRWFAGAFQAPTRAQALGWGPIAAGRSTLLLGPTGSGKTLAAFLVALDRLMFDGAVAPVRATRVLYISPLKALGVDIERNLRAPLHGIRALAERDGVPFRVPTVGVRSGDTPPGERARLQRDPPDILITTPESLYLLLTSNARSTLASVDTVIVDEIHSLAPTKRGAHLFLSLERLEALRTAGAPLQRIGLSATQRPLEEIGRLLVGGVAGPAQDAPVAPRDVEIVDAGGGKAFELRVEVPVEDMSRLGEIDLDAIASGPAAGGPPRRSIWPSMHPRLVELVRAHRSTMIFVNSRRLAERLATALNETAGEEIALAHHGSLARESRAAIEDRLKRGLLPAIVATSSLELGVDMGAVDLVVQIEAPPSVASGMQRIGRAGHQAGAVSRGVIFPKFRGDLLACAAVTARMQEGLVEETFYPRNPLDVLAQHIVAMSVAGPVPVDDLYRRVRGAAPFADLPRRAFDGVLDLLSGRYPSDEMAELRPRVTWDRIAGTVQAREGARLVAVVNAGTIPDRGLYGVFLAGDDGAGSRRVGELDEEMVFESRVGDVFLLGASSWRIQEITHDRVLVTPAPGEPGKMPFWHGDRPGRPVELGRSIGTMTREIAAMPREAALATLAERHGLDARAASNLQAYLAEQQQATGALPTDRTLVLERFQDEVGDHCVALLSPFGARVHAPWATAVGARIRDELGVEVDTMWSDDGVVFRLPGLERPPDAALFLPAADEVEALVVRHLSRTSLFAARFRENAARALLLPRRRPGKRTPLWLQRRKSADLLAVASRFPDFPILLETYRECLRDVFDLPGLVGLLQAIAQRRLEVVTVDTSAASPFAASLMFAYVANFIYEGDAPLAERRAQALSLDQAQLRELLGEPELRELLDADAIDRTERRLQRLDGEAPVKHADGLHDLLLSLGDLSRGEIAARAVDGAPVDAWVDALVRARRAFEVAIGGERRVVAAEDAARLRDALGVVPPAGLPDAFLEPVADALGDLVSRHARTHGPFRLESIAARLGLGAGTVRHALERLAERGRVLEGELLPGGRGLEWCDAGVLRSIKRASLARLRAEVEPVEPSALGRFLPAWQGVPARRRGVDGLLAAVEQLQGAPLPASDLESRILAARVEDYDPRDLDELCSTGEVRWRGVEPLGDSDGRVALYLTTHDARLAPPPGHADGELAARVRELLRGRGALFFADIAAVTGAFGADLVKALWDLVWAGEVTNDTLAPLRSLRRGARRARPGRPAVRGRGLGPPGSEGRWSLIPDLAGAVSATDRATALAAQLLERHGVLTREVVQSEGIAGGFSAVYPVLKAREEAGRVRRGYFVAGLGATQFALAGAEDRLRSHRAAAEQPAAIVLAATDPANPYGASLPWPAPAADGARPQRAAGSRVILVDGALIGHLGRSASTLLTFLPEAERERATALRLLVGALAELVHGGQRRSLLLTRIDGVDAAASPLRAALEDAGFRATLQGLVLRRGAT